MKTAPRREADDARSHLPELLASAKAGQPTIITRHGIPIAALVPMEMLAQHPRPLSLLGLAGTGRGIWDTDSRSALKSLRDEWEP